MSKLDELIQEYCPNGVEYKALGEVCKIETGKLNANAAVAEGEYAFFTTARETSRIDKYRWDTEALLIAGNANVGEVKHYSGKFEAYQRTYVLTEFDCTISVRFLYYSLSNNLKNYLDSHKNEAAMTYIVLSTLEKFCVPVPPLAVQEEIVRILDNFSELTAELKTQLAAELTARKKQYEYYRKLLFCKAKTELKYLLGDIATVKTGSKPKVISEITNKYDYINAGTTRSGYTDTSNCNGDVVTTPSRGQGGIGFVGYQKTAFWLGPLCYGIKSKDETVVINKFLYYYLSCFNEKILKYKNEGGTPSINAIDLKNIEIGLPPLSEQQRIVDILDRFDALCNDISQGLPAEIEARQKQYEYYRDKLLSFSDSGVAISD